MGRLTKWHAIAILAILEILAAGCQQESPEVVDDTGAPDQTSPAMTEATLAAIESGLGVILTGSEGRTVYLFTNDSGSESTCYDACEERWPPLVVTGDPQAGDGVDEALLGTSQRRDGSSQVTYSGHPLYHYSGDQAAGDTNGQGVGGFWFAVTPEGEPVSS